MSTVNCLPSKSTRQTQELLRILQSPNSSGALILGTISTDKSILVESVCSVVSKPHPVIRISCSEALTDIPFGALSPFLGALLNVDDPVAVLRELKKFIKAATPTSKQRIIVIEDAQFLDRQSGFVLAMLAENRLVKLVAVSESLFETGSALELLVSSAKLPTILAEPVGDEDVRRLAERLLDDRLSSGSVAIIRNVTAGIPRFVEAYILSCIEQGILQRVGIQQPHVEGIEQHWVIGRSLPDLDARLTALIQKVHTETVENEQETLEFLALAGPQHATLLAECQLSFDRSLASGMLRQNDLGVVSLSSRIHQHILRQLVPAQRNSRLYELWKKVSGKKDFRHSPSTTAWALRMGEALSSQQILDAAHAAADESDFTLALILCSTGRLSSYSIEAGIFEVHILLSLGRTSTAKAHLLRLINQARSASELHTSIVQLIALSHFLRIDSSHITVLLQQWQEDVRALEFMDDKNRLLRLMDEATSTIDMWNRVNQSEHDPPSIEWLEPVAQNSSTPREFRIMHLTMYGDVWGIQGNCQSALAKIQQATKLLSTTRSMPEVYLAALFFREVWYLVFSGEFNRAQNLATSFRVHQLHLSIGHYGVIALANGLIDLQLGRTNSAIETLAESVCELTVQDPAQLRSTALNLYLLARSRIEILNYEQLPCSLVPSKSTTGSTYSDFSYPQSTPCIYAAATSATVTGKNLAHYPLLHREVHLDLYSSLDDEELVELESMTLLELHSTQVDNPRDMLIAELRALRTNAEPLPMKSLAFEAERRGQYPIAVEALARAAVTYSRTGNSRKCGTLIREVVRILDEQAMTPSRFVSRAVSLCELTVRETEIVLYAQSDKSNVQIAEILTVSPRTVEGHLYRIFAKLGMTNRSELHEYAPKQYLHEYG